MFSLELLLYVLIAMGVLAFISYFWSLERKYDILCFLSGYFIFMAFFWTVVFSVAMGRFDLVFSLISSLVLALLTLALVWVELSKRPELKLLGFIPIVYYFSGYYEPTIWRSDREPGQLSKPSRFLKIRKASYLDKDLKFDKGLSFAGDLANIGYEEIMVHEYVVFVDDERKEPVGLRLTLKTQQRHAINIPSLHIKSSGFHKLRLEALATTVKVSKEVWFFISEDFQKLKYVEIYPLKRWLSPLVKKKLKDL